MGPNYNVRSCIYGTRAGMPLIALLQQLYTLSLQVVAFHKTTFFLDASQDHTRSVVLLVATDAWVLSLALLQKMSPH